MRETPNVMLLTTVALLLATIGGQLLLPLQVFAQQDDDGSLLQAINSSSPDISYPMEDQYEHSKCLPMNIPFCEKLEYNKTMLPNFLGQRTLEDVNSEINIYVPLMRKGCSPDLKLFLCTVYAPMCFENVNDTKAVHLLPCRSLCESARQSCSADLREFNYDWPAPLQCEKFPDKRSHPNIVCVGKDDEPGMSHNSYDLIDRQDYAGSPITRDLGFVCPRNFEVPSYHLHFNGKTYNNCALPCDDVLLDKNGTHLVRLVSGLLAIFCLMSTLFTCITFLINTKRFKYPARPIIIIAFCQLVVAACYLLGFLTGNKIACNEPAEPPKSLPNMKMIRTTTMGNRKGSCTLQFMALYFFQMSSMLWWLMMTLSWHMIARLKWAPEAVSSVSRYFHLFSWAVPALATVYLSVLGNIEGDPLTGTCYVSMSDQESIRMFVIFPTIACLVTGCFFLVSGYKSIWDSREALRREYGKQTNEHYKLVIRIGVFSIFFIVFTFILVYFHMYEQSNLNLWMLSWLSKICNNRDYSIPCPVRNFSNHGPHYSTFILRHGATLAIGILSALFMLSDKTLSSYKEVKELCNYRMHV